MSRIIILSLVSSFVLGMAVLAGETGKGDGSCPVAQKVSTLLASWKTAAEEAKALSPAEREKLQSRLAALAKQCPAGSRMGGTLTTVKDVLGAAIAAEEASARSCPLTAAAEKGGTQTPACAEGQKLKAARSQALRGLHQLACYATDAAGCSACCAAQGAEKPTTASASREGTCTQGGVASAIEIAVRVGALKASWERVGSELAALAAPKRQEILTSADAIAKSSKAVALLPPTVLALAEGFDALDALHGKMGEWARANPEIMKSVSEEARACFHGQQVLIRETREILARAREALKAGGDCAKEAREVETAQKR